MVNHAVPTRTLAEAIPSPSLVTMRTIALALAALGTVAALGTASSPVLAQVASQARGLDAGTQIGRAHV